MNIVILDLEWNGSYSKKVHQYVNEIIEIGAVKVDENLNEIDTFSMLVKPEIGKKLSSHIASLTHISNDELFEKGLSFKAATDKFWEFSADSVILTWGTSDILTLMDNFSYYTGDSEIPFLKSYCNLQEYCEYMLDVHNPAAQLGLKLALAAGAFGDEAVVTARVAEFAVLTGPDYFQKLFVERQEADPEGFHDKEPLFLRNPVEVCGISRAGGKRLLAEHVFAGVKA